MTKFHAMSERSGIARTVVAPLRVFALVIVATLSIGCATTGIVRPPAKLDASDAAGFTITEKARVPSAVRADYAQALAALGQGRHAEGTELLEAVVEAVPQLSAPRIDLAIAYRHAGRMDAAAQQLETVLAARPDHPVAHNELGIVYRETGRLAEARESYRAALAVYPAFHYALRNLAVLCDLYLDDLPCAADNYEAYLASVVSDEQAQMWLADVRMRMGQTEP